MLLLMLLLYHSKDSRFTSGLWKDLIGSIFQFSFPDYVMDVIRREGFQRPTVIQAQVICILI